MSSVLTIKDFLRTRSLNSRPMMMRIWDMGRCFSGSYYLPFIRRRRLRSRPPRPVRVRRSATTVPPAEPLGLSRPKSVPASPSRASSRKEKLLISFSPWCAQDYSEPFTAG